MSRKMIDGRSKMMDIHLHRVGMMGGTKFCTKSVPEDTTVEAFRAALAADVGVSPAERVVLMYGGSQVRDGKRLQQYNIVHDVTMRLMVKPASTPLAIPLAPPLPPPPPTPRLRPTTTTNNQEQLSNEAVARAYGGAFLEKMVGELDEGHTKGVEHVFRNLALYLSPPVTALDGGGKPLAALRDDLPPGVADNYDGLGVDGARLADALLSAMPFDGESAHDPGRVLVSANGGATMTEGAGAGGGRDEEEGEDDDDDDDDDDAATTAATRAAATAAVLAAADKSAAAEDAANISPKEQVDRLFREIFRRAPLSTFQRPRAASAGGGGGAAGGLPP